jgi:trimethylamine---corrinoid protein Co-methyltransferase
MCDFLRLVQALNVLHQEGGCPFEPLDLPANTRHLDIYHAQIRHVDKSWQTQTLGHVRTMDGIEMAAIMLGTTPEALADRRCCWGSSTPTLRCSWTCRWPRG